MRRMTGRLLLALVVALVGTLLVTDLAMAIGLRNCRLFSRRRQASTPAYVVTGGGAGAGTAVDSGGQVPEPPAPGTTDKPEEKPDEKPADEPADKPEDKPADKPEDKPIDNAEDKPADKPADKPEDKPADKPEDKPADKPAAAGTDDVDLNKLFDGLDSGSAESAKPADAPADPPADPPKGGDGAAQPAKPADVNLDDLFNGLDQATPAEKKEDAADKADEPRGGAFEPPQLDPPAAEPKPEAPAEDKPAADDDPFKGAADLPLRRWIDNSGAFETEARLAVIAEGKVRLLKTNGRYCTVPMHRLSDADREYVEQMRAEFGVGAIGQLAGR